MSTDRVITVRRIVEVVARHSGVERARLVGASRSHTTVRARYVAMWLARQLTRRSSVEIGRDLGGRDHSTVLHGIERAEQCLLTDPEMQQVAALSLAEITGRPAVVPDGYADVVLTEPAEGAERRLLALIGGKEVRP